MTKVRTWTEPEVRKALMGLREAINSEPITIGVSKAQRMTRCVHMLMSDMLQDYVDAEQKGGN